MYQAGEYVVYGVQGVCRVLGTECQRINRRRTEFLVLEPLTKGESRFYLPTENSAAIGKLRPVLSRQKLEDLLNADEIRSGCWIPEDNQRKQLYRELVVSGDRILLLQMLAAVYRHKEEQISLGKKLHLCDDNFLRDAEKLLCSEICLVMEMEQDQAKEYLRSKLR